ncbi:hypothetical protein IMG5_115920 [Ichthyophthirius multifiliis]|uniref:Calpain catalytic domain-containing protein n=1 Tax=Ichthyophthirius multifiliis TaxID=5932 RepID=G0QUA3_ICHMU|nr:hypothetical protein IMG5_115920 [Ichthyophthirius multifiliis]EGR31206.1 hypothetical protein IMG5_115920 [Ichthyophthirius multifiliis]|eukprot:XP_004034692.1 hypothetical protein IMG5_115920 [Ichthyophthirius multifiliis]
MENLNEDSNNSNENGNSPQNDSNEQKEDDQNDSDQDAQDYDDQQMNNQQDTSQYQQEQQDNMSRYQEQEAQIIQYWKETGQMWEDPDFRPDNSSLFKDTMNIPEWGKDIRKIVWQRPQQISKDAKFIQDKDGDAKQGAFGESWFIGAIILISTHGDILDKLFVETQYFDNAGFVSFQFFKNGEWKQVIVDTLLPFDQESKQILFTYCASPNEFWIPLMEKAYSKLHGCYQKICEGSILEGLVDLTGGVSEGWVLNDPDTSKLIESNQFWQILNNYFHQKFYLGCINYVEGKGTKNADTGTHGILENHHYGICDIREFPKENLKLIRIRNPWGTDGGWNGPFCDDSEEWDKYRELRDKLKLVFKSKKSDGTWWMSYHDVFLFFLFFFNYKIYEQWYLHFNKLYVCKVFPESWDCYSIESKWQGKTQGGVCPPKMIYDGQENMPEYLQLDTDEKWFNNPQFRLKVTKETKMYISLMLEDEKLTKHSYVQCNFVVILQKDRKNRVWEYPDDNNIIIEANPNGQASAQREITQYITLKKFEGKNYGNYIIVPNMITESKKDEKRVFYLRIFASEPVKYICIYILLYKQIKIEIMEMPETLEFSIEDQQWEQHNAGGRRKIENKNNPNWCRNPQYFLNLKQATNLKIILRKTTQIKKTRTNTIGMTICQYNLNKNKQQQVKGKPIQIQTKGKQTGSNLQRLLAQTDQQLEPPEMIHIERKLFVGYAEKFKESFYKNDEVAALFFSWNPTEGPFIIIPSMNEEDKYAGYKLTIFSNHPVQLQKLDENINSVLIGKWENEVTDGGCHLYDEPFEKEISKKTWTQNPKFLLSFPENVPTNFKITLSIADKNWKAKIKNTVGGMIGIYLLEKREGKISYDDQKVRDVNFLPVQVIEESYFLQNINKAGYYIMPSTYQYKLAGQFILSVTSDKIFTLTPQK